MKKITLIFLVALGVLTLNTQTKTQNTSSTIEKNKQMAYNWYEEGWNNKRYEELIPLFFAEDWSDGNSARDNQSNGHTAMLAMVQNYQEAFPDIRFTISHVVADEKIVSVRFDATATHKGEIFGFKPTGKNLFVSGMVLFEMENGKIKTTWAEMDMESLLNQLSSFYEPDYNVVSGGRGLMAPFQR